jgi:hypothetical protein
MTLVMLALIVGVVGAVAGAVAGAAMAASRLHPDSKSKPDTSTVAAFPFNISFLPSGAMLAGAP